MKRTRDWRKRDRHVYTISQHSWPGGLVARQLFHFMLLAMHRQCWPTYNVDTTLHLQDKSSVTRAQWSNVKYKTSYLLLFFKSKLIYTHWPEEEKMVATRAPSFLDRERRLRSIRIRQHEAQQSIAMTSWRLNFVFVFLVLGGISIVPDHRDKTSVPIEADDICVHTLL